MDFSIIILFLLCLQDSKTQSIQTCLWLRNVSFISITSIPRNINWTWEADNKGTKCFPELGRWIPPLESRWLRWNHRNISHYYKNLDAWFDSISVVSVDGNAMPYLRLHSIKVDYVLALRVKWTLLQLPTVQRQLTSIEMFAIVVTFKHMGSCMVYRLSAHF